MSKRQARQPSFKQPLAPVLVSGIGLAIGFFALILLGPLDHELLRRYCLNHPVAIACICLFFVGAVTLLLKWVTCLRQTQLADKAAHALEKITREAEGVKPADRADWLHAHWRSLPRLLADSWFGQRVSAVLELQINRGRRHQLESDLSNFAEQEADRQHESYSLLRIINWAMPMLGFLGTVLGISQTLGQLDTELLATQQQEAMNQLTAGLYVAFDTTATALVLTVGLMFLQFAVSRLELGLLIQTAEQSQKILIPFVGVDPHDSQASLLAPVRELSEALLGDIRQLTEAQAEIWMRSISQSQQQWSEWTSQLSAGVQDNMGQALGQALNQHVEGLRVLQGEADSHFAARWQQWQTTLSEQARQTRAQQQEIAQHSQTLEKVLQSLTELTNAVSNLTQLETTIQESVSRLENIGRLEEASHCVGEAVAVLATSLERAGVLRGAPTKPRHALREERTVDHAADTAASRGQTNLQTRIDEKGKAA